MKKSIIIIGAVILGIIIPFLGMTITPTRNLILGLAPEDAILQLADKIDENRNESDFKIQELQSVIDAQQNQIAGQNTKLTEQQQNIDSQNTAIYATQTEVVKSRDCSSDVNKYCVSDSFREADKFADFLKVYEKNFDKDAYGKYKKQFTEQYDNCQRALTCK